MKRYLGVFLGATLALGVGCSEDEVAATSNSFTADYDLGLYIKSAGRITSETLSYIDLGGEITQVDQLSAAATTSATSGVCQIDPDMPKTVYARDTSAESSLRIAGQQKAWLMPGTYYPDNNDEANDNDMGVHTWGDPSYGDLFFSEPSLDIWLWQQAEADCNCKLDNYLDTIPVDLHIFEEEYVESYTEVETYSDVNLNYVDTYQEHSDVDLGTFTRFVLDGYVWETGEINDFYTDNSVDYYADMILPNSVKVGDTWLDNNGNLVAAVGIEAVEVAGKKVRALHVVYRGSTDVADAIKGAADNCIDFYDSYNEDNDGTITVGKRAARKANCVSDEDASGFINQRHVWFYKGLPVKVEEESVEIDLQNYGYVAGNDDNLPGGHNGGLGNTVGNCAYYTTTGGNDVSTNITGDEDQIARLQPYAQFSVTKTRESWVATEIRDDFTIVTEYREDMKAAGN